MKTKICTKCKEEKSLDEFSSDKRVLDEKRSKCKECCGLANKKYYEEHKNEVKKYNQKHKEEIKIYQKKYQKKYHKKYYQEHKKELKKYQEEHKEEITEYINKYCIKRRKIDINFKILGNLRTRIRAVLKGKCKSLSTMILIGCEIDYLLYHLQSQFTKGMDWDNHGEWHIDHIRPCASFDLSKESEQHKCFNYKNLQPLWAKDNLSKGAKY